MQVAAFSPKSMTIILCMVVFAVQAPSQTSSTSDLKTLLQDSAYVFNRYDEETAGLDTEVDQWNVPDSLKATFKEELAAVSRNVTEEKPRLYRLLNAEKVSSADLFDVYSELIEISGEIQGQATNSADFGHNSAMSTNLAQLGARANVLGAKIGFVLRSQIVQQEHELATCKRTNRNQ